VKSVDRLLEIMARLRDPEGGCPWDLEQDFASIAPYTVEEAYEVEDAIQRADMRALREELGDLLLQVVFHAQLAREAGHFDLEAVAESICEKLVRRHPHVFGSARVDSAEAQTRAWEEHKARERTSRAQREGGAAHALAEVPLGLPALLRAGKLHSRAARSGLSRAVTAPHPEELVARLAELLRASAGADGAAQERELGELLLACAALAQERGLDAESALRAACHRFEARFRRLEDELAARGQRIESLAAEELRALWQRAEPAEPQR
jgi:ATP diphosphatase